jgi:hypothetical protein
MYIVGHTALAYLVLRPFLRSKDPNLPINILFIFIFANIIDLMNYSYFRYYGHNLFGTFFIAGICLVVFKKFKLIENRIIPLLLIATGTHVIADVIFSEYHLFAPFDNKAIALIGYNPVIGHLAESILFGIFFMVIILTKDHLKLKDFLIKEKIKVSQPFEYTNSYGKGLIVSMVFIAFFLFSILQLMYFSFESMFYLSHYYKRTWLYLGAFIIFLSILIYVGFLDGSKSKKNDHPFSD